MSINESSTSKKIPIAHKATQYQQRRFFTIVGILFIISLFFIDVNLQAISAGIERLPGILREVTSLSFENFGAMLSAMLTTLVIAFLAVLISFSISFCISFLVANNTTPNKFVGVFSVIF
ncbi:hypothetical protein [Salibacterium salarium]|uniref:hypothetical protein n=1 Tax=Salibacterium salarium TaxID=284579 RepID=UPI001FE44CDB|nr:hypothetical protein [Salibacterium salarium]